MALAGVAEAQVRLVYELDGHAQPIAGIAAGAPAVLRDGRLIPIRDGGLFRFEAAPAFAPVDTDTVLRYQINRVVDATRHTNRERWIVAWQLDIQARLDVPQLHAVRAWEKDGRISRVAIKLVPPVLKGTRQPLADQFEIDESDSDGRLRVHVFRGAEEIRSFPAVHGDAVDPQALLGLDTLIEQWRGLPGAAAMAKKVRLSDFLAVVRAGRREALEALIALGTPARGKDQQGRHALHAAAESGRAEVVPLLAQAGVEVNLRDMHGYTALMRAAALGHESTVAALVAAGAKLDIENQGGDTALTLASLNGRADLIRALMTAGAKWPRPSQRLSELLAGSVRSRHTDVIPLLLAAGADANYKAGQVPLIVLAAATATWQEAEPLLKAGASLAARDGAGATALMHAARRDRVDLVNLLLAAGADVDATDQRGYTALLDALERNCRSVPPVLRERGASVAPVARLGEPALRNAILRGDRAMVAQLHADGARLHRTTGTAAVDDTLLAQAIALGFDDVVASALGNGWTLRTMLFGAWTLAEVTERYKQVAMWERLVRDRPGEKPPAEAPSIVRSNSRTDPLVPVLRVTPEYPAVLSATQGTGEATVHFWVTPDGQAVLPNIVKTSRPELAVPAQRALLGWRFAPSKLRPPGWRQAEIPFSFVEPQLGQAQVFNAARVDQQAAPLRQTKPEPPADFPPDKIGAVWISIVVDDTGKVSAQKLRAATDDGLAENVFAAVRDWEFRPARVGDRPVWVRNDLFILLPSGEDLPADGVSPALMPVGAKTTLPRVVDQVAPIYPKERLNERRTYLAIMEFTILERGNVADAHIVAGSDELFNRAAVEAVKKWRFKAPVIDGKATTLKMRMPVIFVPPSESALTF